jgi:hypothetical protein
MNTAFENRNVAASHFSISIPLSYLNSLELSSLSLTILYSATVSKTIDATASNVITQIGIIYLNNNISNNVAIATDMLNIVNRLNSLAFLFQYSK